MKQKVIRGLLAAGGLLLIWLLPCQRRDVAQLIPVEALIVSVEDGAVVLTGKDCQGRGESWTEACEDLLQSGEGIVFLETAEQLILAADAVDLLSEAAESGLLRPAAMVCVAVGTVPEPEEAASYLASHSSGVTLRQIQAAKVQGKQLQLPLLIKTEGGLRIYETNHR